MNLRLAIVLLASIIAINVHPSRSANTGHRQRYGEVCNKSRKCDFTKWFRCRQMKCTCYNPPGKEELYYEESAKRCVGKARTNCAQKFYPFDDEDEKIFHSRGVTTNHWRYGNGTLKCGANAFCEFDGKDHFCKCKRNFFEAEDGTCAKLKGYGDSCKVDDECDPDLFLGCDENAGTCKCDSNRVYDTDLNKCIVAAGDPCENKKNKDDGRILDDCAKDSFCEEGVCRCGFGTQIHSDRTCQKGYGMECGPDHPCGDSKLSCRSKVCQCKYPLHMEYDETSGQCVSLAGGPCHMNDTISEFSLYCTQNAECKILDVVAECQCKKGYFQTEGGRCVKQFGSTCEYDIECDPGLACINNNCSCPDMLQLFDPKLRKCRGLYGSRCNLTNPEHACVQNAICKNFEQEEHGKIGRCSCLSNFKPTYSRTCE